MGKWRALEGVTTIIKTTLAFVAESSGRVIERAEDTLAVADPDGVGDGSVLGQAEQ